MAGARGRAHAAPPLEGGHLPLPGRPARYQKALGREGRLSPPARRAAVSAVREDPFGTHPLFDAGSVALILDLSTPVGAVGLALAGLP